MKASMNLLGAMLLLLALLSPAWPQGKPEKPAESSPPTSPSPDPKQAPQKQPAASTPAPRTSSRATIFMGTIVRQPTGYVLRAADLEYRLDDQSKAREFEGKNVKITGKLDAGSKTLHVEKIENSPSM